MQISTTLQDQFANAIDTELSTVAFARFYTGTTATPGTKLATCAMDNPAFGAAASGVITMGTTGPVQDVAPVAGVAAMLALYTTSAATSGAFVVAMGVHATTQEITMANTTIATTDTVQVSSLTITVPVGALA